MAILIIPDRVKTSLIRRGSSAFLDRLGPFFFFFFFLVFFFFLFFFFVFWVFFFFCFFFFFFFFGGEGFFPLWVCFEGVGGEGVFCSFLVFFFFSP